MIALRRTVVGIGLLTSLLMGIVMAGGPRGAEKRPLYGPQNFVNWTCPGGSNAVGTIHGFVVMNTDSNGTLKAEVSIKAGTPNATYDIYVNQDPGDCPTMPTGTLSTNANGHGNAHVTEPRFLTATSFWVSAVQLPCLPCDQVLRSPAVILD